MALNFILDLHKRRNITRKDVLDVQTSVKNLYSCLENLIRSAIPLETCDPQTQYITDIYLQKMSTMFNFIDTEHKFFKYLSELDLFSHPKTFIVKNNTISETESSMQIKSTHLVLMNLKFQIRKFLETEDVLSEMIKNMHNLMQMRDKHCNFVNGTLYQNTLQQNPGKLIIPLFLYTDEFEINDPLSSHNKRHSICGLYYFFPTLPEHHLGKLCNIFIAGAIKKVDIAEHGIDAFMTHVVEEFKEIEENGLNIRTKTQDYKVHVSLMLIQGDNLGIHQTLKFAGSFSAKFYCRYCRRAKEFLQYDLTECEEYIRTNENYEIDVSLKQSESGLTGRSVFNRLSSFHAIKNFFADCMHDLYSSGVCLYGFVEIISYCVYTKRYCTLSDINKQRKSLNNYHFEQAMSRMPDLDEIYIKSKKSKSVSMRMTANEMAVFSNYFTFILGPFVPSDDPVWKYARVLIQMIDIINLPVFTTKDLGNLSDLVSEHHSLYITLFNQQLKPKQHFLTHYARIIKNSGPLKKMSCFRLEARHRDFKEYFDVSSSRKNICLTMCIKANLYFTHDEVNSTFIKSFTSGIYNETTLGEKPYIDNVCNAEINREEIVKTAQSIIYNNIKYRSGNFVSVTQESIVELYQIVEFLKYNKEDYAVVSRWKVECFSEHYQAFIVGDKLDDFYILMMSVFDGPPFSVENIEKRVMFRRKLYYVGE